MFVIVIRKEYTPELFDSVLFRHVVGKALHSYSSKPSLSIV